MREELYTSIEDAKEEIIKRQNNQQLKSAVTKYLGEIPAPFNDGPRAVLFRNIISPNTELLRFLEETKKLGIRGLGTEYTGDKFSTRNQDKMALAKLPLMRGRNKDKSLIIQNKKVIDIKASDNKSFRNILTLGNESLPHFHHCLLRDYIGSDLELFDLTDHLKTWGNSVTDHYRKFFSLFIFHGILFETFITSGTEADFTNNVVYPAFLHTKNEFGFSPIIVKSIDENKGLDYWRYYPDDILNN